MQQSGIYKIESKSTGKFYVGSSIDISKRLKSHKFHLNRGSHANQHLQSSYIKHGADDFIFSTIIVCAPNDVLLYEQKAIDGLNPDFNICKKAGSCAGIKLSDEAKNKISLKAMGNQRTLGMKHTPETIEKLRVRQMGVESPTKGKKRNPEAVSATAVAHRGMKRSNETKKKISEATKGRKFVRFNDDYRKKLSIANQGKGQFSDQKIREIRDLIKLGATHQFIADANNCNRSLISMIASGKRYGWVQ